MGRGSWKAIICVTPGRVSNRLVLTVLLSFFIFSVWLLFHPSHRPPIWETWITKVKENKHSPRLVHLKTSNHRPTGSLKEDVRSPRLVHLKTTNHRPTGSLKQDVRSRRLVHLKTSNHRPTGSLNENQHSPRFVDLKTFNFTVSQIQMSEKDRHNTYSLIREFQLLMASCSIDYVANGGTILGAARHGGLIPWDDDTDFVIMKRNAKSFFRTIRSQNILKLCYMNDDFYKVAFRNSNLSKNTNKYCGWPNLDVFLAHDMGPHLKVNFLGSYIYNKTSFFPAVVVPFGPLYLRVPRCFLQLAIEAYDFEKCCTGSWNHRIEDWAPRPACVFCRQLANFIPFSSYIRMTEDKARMILSVDGKVIRQETVKMPKCGRVYIKFIKQGTYEPVVKQRKHA